MTHRIDPETTPQQDRPYAVCPNCGAPAIHDVTRLVRGVYLANYTDGTHMWDTRWLAAA